jgi:hypothetical protein
MLGVVVMIMISSFLLDGVKKRGCGLEVKYFLCLTGLIRIMF